jgi:phosphoglycolate phosphatase
MGCFSVRYDAMATAIIFDLDGTIADSTACVVGAAQTVGKTAGLRVVSDEAIRQRIGEPLGPMLAALFGVDGAILNELVAAYSSEYVRLTATMERPFAGSIPMLQTLREAGFKLAIATGKSQSGAERATQRMGLEPYFDSVHGIIPGTPGKPDPAVLVRALDALNVGHQEAIMVGDTTYDLDLSAAIGVRNAAVSWGVHDAAVLKGRQPAFFAKTMSDLCDWLLQQR